MILTGKETKVKAANLEAGLTIFNGNEVKQSAAHVEFVPLKGEAEQAEILKIRGYSCEMK